MKQKLNSVYHRMSYTLRPTIINRKLTDEEGVHRANIRVEVTPIRKRRYYAEQEHIGNQLTQSRAQITIHDSSEEEECSTEEYL